MDKLEELKSILDGMDEETLAKAKEYLKEVVKDGCSTEDEEAKKKAEEEAKAKKEAEDKKKAEDEAAKKAAEDEAAKKAEEEKKKAEDEAAKKEAEVKDEAIRKEARDNLREAIKLHDALVPHIGEFCMDEMFTADQVAKYGCEKLKLDVNAGSELATLTGYLAGCKGKTEKVITVDHAAEGAKTSFSFAAAYLAK